MSSPKEGKGIILIVDDKPENLGVLFDCLNSAGFEALVAQDGHSAIELAENERPDLILLDIMMPGTDGFETCRALKQNAATGEIPIIFITARTETADKIKGFELGAVDYITKPFQQQEVLARIHNHLTIRNLRRELEAQNTQLQELNASKDKFFSIISHDMRGPFTRILGAAELLHDHHHILSVDQVKHLVADMDAASRAALNFFEGLLDWVKIQRGQMRPELQSIALKTLVESTLEFHRIAIQQKHLTFANLVETGRLAYADERMFGTVLRNLISNAIKFTPNGGQVTVICEDNPNGQLEIMVKDTGIGMTAAQLDLLFKVGVSNKSVGTAGETGSGFGLILCHDLIELMGGRIWAESAPGQGTVFRFVLPGIR